VMDWGIAKVLSENGCADDGVAAAIPAELTTAETIRDEEAGPETSAAETLPGMLLGTLAYMSPEQASRTSPLGKRADGFSLGAVLGAFLTGSPASPGTKGKVLYRKARHADLADALTRLDDCKADPQLVALAKHCLAADPNQRPADAGEVLRQLRNYLDALF